MKNLLIFFCFLLLSCSQTKDAIKVQYTPSSGVKLLSSSVFDDIEIIPLHGEMMPVLKPWCSMIVQNDTYYISSDIVHLFDMNGKYLKSIGTNGRGPREFMYISNTTIEENGDISVYSSPEGLMFHYSPQGKFLGTTDYKSKAVALAIANGFKYHFFGNGRSPAFQLFVADNQDKVIGSYWPSSPVQNLIISPVFSEYNDTLILCPPYGGEVYKLFDGNVEVSYTFDFGAYEFPDEYFQGANNRGLNYLMNNRVAIKNMFFENQKYAFLQVLISDSGNNSERMLYGILEKATSTWEWHYMNDDDFMSHYNLKFIDDSYVYFMAEPELMKEAGLADRFPILNTLSINDGMVILKCKK